MPFHRKDNLAEAAFDCFGKGRHPAGLNMGDRCFAYAFAAVGNAPLALMGDDFGRTDIARRPASVVIEWSSGWR